MRAHGFVCCTLLAGLIAAFGTEVWTLGGSIAVPGAAHAAPEAQEKPGMSGKPVEARAGPAAPAEVLVLAPAKDPRADAERLRHRPLPRRSPCQSLSLPLVRWTWTRITTTAATTRSAR